MISYCSENHRQQHLSIHEDFCQAVRELLKTKNITHIYEELIDIKGLEWETKRKKIIMEIIKKLERSLSPLESFMLDSPRICFQCLKTKQEDLINCPHCPIASFCGDCKNDETHDECCKLMNKYLNVLTTAEKLNIDLEFLSSGFPFTGEKGYSLDALTVTYKKGSTDAFEGFSKSCKTSLINFIDTNSKINNALEKIHETIPEELTIHIDSLNYDFAVGIVEYSEFLLHLNPWIKKLKIVMTVCRDPSRLRKSLCKNCHLEGRNFIFETTQKSYEDYMLKENYQEPDILFYVRMNIKRVFQKFKTWNKLNCPIILQFDSNTKYLEAQHFLSSPGATFRFIHEGQLKTAFSTLASIENKDYFIILQSKESKELEKSASSATGETNEKTNTPARSSSKRSFAATSNPKEKADEEKNKKLKSIDKENFHPSGVEGKIAINENKVNSQSYLIEHILYLNKENEGLRQQLNSSFNEVTKLQTKLDQVSFDLDKILRGIVDSGETLQ